jgi:hypothetical protein
MENRPRKAERMLDRIYRIGRILMSRAWTIGLALIVLTVGFGTRGFLRTTWEDGTPLRFLDAAYKAVSLLAIEFGDRSIAGIWQLELARWSGMLFWASALVTLVIRLFQEGVNRHLTKWLANDHIILAGLGQNGSRLVQALRARRRTVVVIEPDRSHPSLGECRRAGAIVLHGEPDDAAMLRYARLDHASAILALFIDESACVHAATAAYGILKDQKATSDKPPVRCVLRLCEPGLIDVIRSHTIKTNPADRIQLEVLNSHEIAATTMVREAAANSLGPIRKIVVLSLGTHHRLGEMVILRALKDHFIAHNGQVDEKLVIHVCDREAAAWLVSFRSRYPFVDAVGSIVPRKCWARKVGASGFEHDYDAAFVCIADEGHATAQAVMLRREVLTGGQPIMVRVRHSRSGCGELFSVPDSGWGRNIHAIGLDDSLFDPDTATKPEMELRAQTIHHDYRARMKNQHEPANRPWSSLSETFRESNRQLAARYASHLSHTDGNGKTLAYRWSFHPDGFTRVDPSQPLLFQFSAPELETLAAREHGLWKSERERAGWRFGPIKSKDDLTNPLMVDYSQLTDESAREYNRDFVRSIPRILALADYTIVPDTP